MFIEQNNTDSKTYIIKKLRESISQKQKKIELKKEQYYKILDDINNNKKEKMGKKLQNSTSMNVNEIKELQALFQNKKIKNYNSFNNLLQSSLSQDYYLTLDNNSKSNKDNLLTLPPIDKNINDQNIFSSRVNIHTETIPIIKNLKLNKKQNTMKRSDFISNDDIYNKETLSPSLFKEKYIIFKSPNRQIREDHIKINKDLKNKFKSLAPIRLRKDYNKNDMNEEKKIEYLNIVSIENQNKKKNIEFNNIKEKYKQLSNLVKSLQKTTSEILDKKSI